MKQIPYYLDTTVQQGVVYQYGIVTNGYKESSMSPALSDIVWQSFSDENKPATGTGILAPGAKEKGELPALPTATFTKVQISHPGTAPITGQADTPEEILVEVTGLVPGYSYNFAIQQVNVANPTEAADWGSFSSSGYSTSIAYNSTWAGAKLDGKSDPYRFEVPNSFVPSDYYTPANYNNFKARLVVQIDTVLPNRYIEKTGIDYNAADTVPRLNSNEKIISSAYLTF